MNSPACMARAAPRHPAQCSWQPSRPTRSRMAVRDALREVGARGKPNIRRRDACLELEGQWAHRRPDPLDQVNQLCSSLGGQDPIAALAGANRHRIERSTELNGSPCERAGSALDTSTSSAASIWPLRWSQPLSELARQIGTMARCTRYRRTARTLPRRLRAGQQKRNSTR